MARVGFVLPKTYAVSTLKRHTSYLLRSHSASVHVLISVAARWSPCHIPMMQSRWTRTMIPTCSDQRRQEPSLLQHHHYKRSMQSWSCGVTFTVDHAMVCHMGGFPTIRHNEIRDITASLLTEVCHMSPLSHPYNH